VGIPAGVRLAGRDGGADRLGRRYDRRLGRADLCHALRLCVCAGGRDLDIIAVHDYHGGAGPRRHLAGAGPEGSTAVAQRIEEAAMRVLLVLVALLLTAAVPQARAEE